MSDEPKKKPSPQRAKIFEKIRFEALKDPKAQKETPALLDVLLPIFRDGVLVRQPGRLAIQADGMAWRVRIECPTELLETVVACDSLLTLLQELEVALTSGKLHWGQSWSARKKNLPTIDAVVQ